MHGEHALMFAALSRTEYLSIMATMIEIEKLALDLPEHDRATLAANLLDSLPPILADEDGGIAEALRRDAELDADPSLSVSFEELDARVRNRHK
jgi:putative addiction module component (TIGR02574 family)